MDLQYLLTLIQSGESERVEFKKKPTKTLHHEIAAFANADGGHIIIGVDDKGTILGTDVKAALEKVTSSLQSIIPPPRITTHKITVDDRDVLVIGIEKSSVLCSIGGVVYIRIGTSVRPLSIQEILMIASEMGTFNWDETPMIPKKDADPDYIDWFFEKVRESRGKTIAEGDRNRYLRSAGALRNEKLTNAGVLFFTNATEHIPYARIRRIGMEKEGPVWSKEYEGQVWQVIETAYTDLLRDIRRLDVVVGARRIKIDEYPPRAIREAIINAVAHRNYTINADVKIFHYPDRFEIKNPGGLLPGVDLTDPEHIPRNPALSNLLYDTGYIERYGFGIRMIHDEVDRNPLCSVEFKSSSATFTVIFRKEMSLVMDDTDQEIMKNLNKSMKSSEIAQLLRVSKPTAIRRLKKLEELDLVEREGKGAHTRYVIKR
jgi:ATP-dependent DNA helicase RecG